MSKYKNKSKKIRMEFFELKKPSDLINKAKADFEELKKSPSNSYKAFNFFITIEHIADWLNAKDERKKEVALRIVSHLANGAKHFEIDSNRHCSVKDTGRDRVYEEGVFEEDVFYEPLVVYITDKEAIELNLKTDKIDVIELGQMALDFWIKYAEKFKNNKD